MTEQPNETDQRTPPAPDNGKGLAGFAILLAAWPAVLLGMWWLPGLEGFPEALSCIPGVLSSVAPISMLAAIIMAFRVLIFKRCGKLLATGVLLVAIAVTGLFLHTYKLAIEVAQTTVCFSGVTAIKYALVNYHEANGNYPASLEELTAGDEPLLKNPEVLKCTMAWSDESNNDYFYLAPDPNAPENTLLMCDYLRNHNGENRNVTFVSGRVDNCEEEEFQKLLAQPQNAAFAAALKKAEAERSGDK